MGVMFISNENTSSGIVGADFGAVFQNAFFDRYRDTHELIVSTAHENMPVGIIPKGEGLAPQGQLIGNFVEVV